MSQEIADSRDSSKNTIRVITQNDSIEDFVGTKTVFYTAFVNDAVWTGDRVIEEEKYLEIYRYDLNNSNDDGNLPGKCFAMFRGNQWKYARAI